ncbi:alpha-1,3-mannosyl-glycoprotein 4-beta-N-acetylglucosaminyltransferase C-like isoform X2 [Lineus longissimus]|uniref:alpha-1,3-mannosyl-glycoprotein 4-beta-N-acetylglucosaminyltransferase C-like isoform X2 n=1 Tax=Lineus longissimus TaxID=88925 RepID=UPI00315DB67C
MVYGKKGTGKKGMVARNLCKFCVSLLNSNKVQLLLCLALILNAFLLIRMARGRAVTMKTQAYYNSEDIRHNLKMETAEHRPWRTADKLEMAGVAALEQFGRAVKYGLPKLYGRPRKERVFLTIGIPSIPRNNGDIYILKTIDKFILMTSPEEQNDVILVIYLGTFAKARTSATAEQIFNKYGDYIESGFIHIVEALEDFYPNLNINKLNYKDSQNRVRWRSKQTVDFAYMFTYCQNLSRFHLQVEDDVIPARHYVQAIKQYILEVRQQTWSTLEFSGLGYIGKLHKSEELPSIALFYMMFYFEKPVDWLLFDYMGMRVQPKRLIRPKALFQHKGVVSSLDGKKNPLVDNTFDKIAVTEKPNNPNAKLYTNMSVFGHNDISNAYGTDHTKFFWGKTPHKNDVIFLIFDTAVKLDRVIIHSGNAHYPNDFIRFGRVDASPRVQNRSSDATHLKCADYKNLGSLEEGVMDAHGLGFSIPFETKCLRIKLEQDQDQWIMLKDISVYTVKRQTSPSPK